MNIFTKLTVAALALGVSACTDPDRFGANGGPGSGNPATTPGANTGIDQSALDPASDPTNPAYFRQTVGDRVLFAVDTATLTDAGRATLRGQAQWLQTNSDYLAVVEGHADEQGTREYNLALGARRANAVREFLIAQGIPSSRMRTVSYGKERPIEVCSEESCYAQNRRAVTIISAGALS